MVRRPPEGQPGQAARGSSWRGWPASSFAALAIYLFFATAAGSAGVAGPSLVAYRGLGTWVDIYDTTSWAHPETMVARMKARGVRTLYLETGNYRQTVDVVRPSGQARFIDAAQGAG